MNIFDCTTQLPVFTELERDKWLCQESYKLVDSIVYSIDTANLEVKFEVFHRANDDKWAVYYPPATQSEGVDLLYANINNASYAWLILELGVKSLDSAVLFQNHFANLKEI